MPKMKSNSAAKKRFIVLKSGKVKRKCQHRGHILTKKSTKRKRQLRRGSYVFEGEAKTIKQLVGGIN